MKTKSFVLIVLATLSSLVYVSSCDNRDPQEEPLITIIPDDSYKFYVPIPLPAVSDCTMVPVPQDSLGISVESEITTNISCALNPNAIWTVKRITYTTVGPEMTRVPAGCIAETYACRDGHWVLIETVEGLECFAL